MLLFLATGMSRLRVMVPDGQFELLPVLLPPFLHQLVELVAADLPASLRRPIEPASRCDASSIRPLARRGAPVALV
ncbi:hypothetical protein [Micromonospora sp. NPDC049891]|uniref:hypothetical protein n=1 Tax=Micromonospora sp. NPDC049891 TaxID=3155655 RepID=UPI0033F71074